MSEKIKTCDYRDLRDIGLRWVCRCDICLEFFLGIKNDWVCERCSEKPEIKTGDE